MIGRLFHKFIFAFAKFLAPKIGETEGGRNFDKNVELEPKLVKGLITNQAGLKGMGYGDSDIGKTGCEAIALFNILLLRGRPRPLSYIIRDLQENQLLINRGRWGTNPFELDDLMVRYGLDPEEMETVEEAESKMEVGDLLFPTVWNNKGNIFNGIHGYVIEKVGESKYHVYNKDYRSEPELVSNLREAIGKGRYIVGYLIR